MTPQMSSYLAREMFIFNAWNSALPSKNRSSSPWQFFLLLLLDSWIYGVPTGLGGWWRGRHLCICLLDSVFEWLYLLCIRAETGEISKKDSWWDSTARELFQAIRTLVDVGPEAESRAWREEIRSLLYLQYRRCSIWPGDCHFQIVSTL